MQAKLNSKNFSTTDKNSQTPQLNICQDIVICVGCTGRNHQENMNRQPDGSYVCDFCQLDENEPIPVVVFIPVAREVSDVHNPR